MRKTWIFFKLRMLQMKSDKSALFFCYVLPVLLLLFVGYPLQMKGDPEIVVFYTVSTGSTEAPAILEQLRQQPLIKLEPYRNAAVPARAALESNDIKHYLEVGPSTHTLYSNSVDGNRVENAALQSLVEEMSGSGGRAGLTQTVASDKVTSYVATLLPGLIGMTLLIIGLNGFGAALVTEKEQGLHKNIKTIDVSPVPFLTGLFVSRLLIAYSVAIALFAGAVVIFGISVHINYLLLALVVTLGSVAFLGLGLMLATLTSSATAFSGIVNVVQMPLIVLGGVFFSASTFPPWLRIVTDLLPLTQLNEAMRSLLFESAGFAHMSPLYVPIAGLAVWCVLTVSVARARFRW